MLLDWTGKIEGSVAFPWQMSAKTPLAKVLTSPWAVSARVGQPPRSRHSPAADTLLHFVNTGIGSMCLIYNVVWLHLLYCKMKWKL